MELFVWPQLILPCQMGVAFSNFKNRSLGIRAINLTSSYVDIMNGFVCFINMAAAWIIGRVAPYR